jgi:hypothetical protein
MRKEKINERRNEERIYILKKLPNSIYCCQPKKLFIIHNGCKNDLFNWIRTGKTEQCRNILRRKREQ